MNWEWLIWSAAGIGALLGAGAGGFLLVMACTGRRPVMWGPSAGRVEDPREAVEFSDPEVVSGGRCACCDYDLCGLEHGYCPECGWAYAEGWRLPWRRRLRAAWMGVMALGLATSAVLTPHVLKHGVCHLMPTAVLAAAMPLGPAVKMDNGALRNELQARLEEGRVRGWECELLASSAAMLMRMTVNQREEAACRESVATMLERIAASGHVESSLLMRVMEDPSPRVRMHGAEALGRLARNSAGPEHAAAMQRLMTAVMCDRDVRVRRQAVEALGAVSVSTPQAMGVLARAARDPAPQVRARAMYSLYNCSQSSLSTDSALNSATLGAHDADAGVREAATVALSRLGERIDSAVMVLGLSLRDNSVDVRRSAADLLARMGPRAAPAWGALLASVADVDPSVQASVAEALRAIGES